MSDESLQIFADEAEDLLSVAEQALLNLDNLDDENETQDSINDLFRTFHTIKGAAGLFGLETIVDFTHVVESVLSKVREGTLSVDEDMVSLFLLSRDHLEQLVGETLAGNDTLSAPMQLQDDELVAKLNLYLGVQAQDESGDSVSVTSQQNDGQGVDNENWHISLRFGVDALRNGMDPASFISYLGKLGELKSVVLIDDAIPTWQDFDPESCYLGFEIELFAPNTTKETIEEVFEFVQDDCRIFILPPYSHIDVYIQMINDLPEQDMRIGEILVACGALTSREKDQVLNIQEEAIDQITAEAGLQPPPLLGTVAVEQNVVQKAVVDAAFKKQNETKKHSNNAQQTIRVNALKLESLVNLVGELVIGSANAELYARRVADTNLNQAMENLLRLIEEVRDTTLGLRMVQIGETFNRYKRVVREVSRDLGKEINLTISGAETELDKTLIEKIADPLMHLVRNAIDHGIEAPDVRLERGKPAVGTVSLDAFHDSGSIVIEVRDDGGGLSTEKILAKAVERGLVQADQQLSEREIFQLIFEAGFSTAATISNISGRGVGMDVVRKNIEALRGQVEIDSLEGAGSTISIRLPLTLAIIDGFQVRVSNSKYIIPLDMIHECIELTEALRGSEDDAHYINLRGEILPFVYLTDMFNEPHSTHAKQRENIVVVRFAGKKAGFVVDELLGEHQTVLKPLGKVFQQLKGISGATILGSGEVAMVLDIAELLTRVINQRPQNQQAVLEVTE